MRARLGVEARAFADSRSSGESGPYRHESPLRHFALHPLVGIGVQPPMHQCIRRKKIDTVKVPNPYPPRIPTTLTEAFQR